MKKMLFFIAINLLFMKVSYGQWTGVGPVGGVVFPLAVSNNNLIAGSYSGITISTNNGSSWTPTGMNVYFVYALFAADDFVYAGTSDSGVYKSSDNGLTWSVTALNNKNIQSVTANSSVVLAGTSGEGVYYSTDKGNSWTQSSLSTGTVSAVMIDGAAMFAGAVSSGVYKSTDGGATWTQTTLNNKTVYALKVINGKIFAATYGSGIYVSADGGSTWTKTTMPNRYIYTLANANGAIYAGTWYYGVYKSTDEGTTWSLTTLNTGVLSIVTKNDSIFASTWGNGVHVSTDAAATWNSTPFYGGNVMSMTKTGDNLLVGTEYNQIFRSTDNGNNWTQSLLSSAQKNVSALTSSGNIVLAGVSDSGIYRSTDSGLNWVRTSLINKNIRCLLVNGTSAIAGTLQSGIYYSTDQGATWTQSSIDVSSFYCLTSFEDKFYTGSLDGVGYSTDNGATWIPVGLSGKVIEGIAFIGRKMFAGAAKFMAENGGVYVSTDFGANWTATTLQDKDISSLTSNDSVLVAGTSSGEIYVSLDQGNTWTAKNEGLYGSGINCLLLSDNYVFTGTRYHSALRRIISEILPVELTSFTASLNGSSAILNWQTATETNNKGFSIERKTGSGNYETIGFINGKGTTTEKQLYSYTDKNLAAGKYVYRLKQMDYDGTYSYSNEAEIDMSVPAVYTLEQNYPNPFNPETVIKFNLASDSKVTLKVYNSIGQEVATLVNGTLPAGNQQANFNAVKLSSGVYIYKLEAAGVNGENFSSVKKMLLMK